MKKRHYIKAVDTYDQKWRDYTKTTLHKVIEFLPASLEGKKVLDFGCGTGELIKKLLMLKPELAHIRGYDPVKEMIWQAQKKVEQLPENQQKKVKLQSKQEYGTKFDLVVSSSVLHYLPKPEETLLHFHSLLQKGGTLVLLDYTKNSFVVKYFRWIVKLIDPMHQQAYFPEQIREMVEKAGFHTEQDEAFRISSLWKGYVIRASKQ